MLEKSCDVNEIDVHEKQEYGMNVARQMGIEELVLTDEFSAIPAYKEILPDGLIADEV